MKRLHLATWLVAGAFVAACGSAGTGTSNTNSYSGKTIKLGAILSITGAGGVYGPQSRDGMNLAVKQINDQIDGMPLVEIYLRSWEIIPVESCLTVNVSAMA